MSIYQYILAYNSTPTLYFAKKLIEAESSTVKMESIDESLFFGNNSIRKSVYFVVIVGNESSA